jgi:predicted RND superfamily exporter protein
MLKRKSEMNDLNAESEVDAAVDQKSDEQKQSHLSFESGDSSPSAAAFVLQRRGPLGRPIALWLVALIVLSVVPMGFELRHIRLENTVEDWLPANDPQRQVLNWFQHEFEDDEAIVITWSTSVYDDSRIVALATELNRPEATAVGIHRVTTPADLVQQMHSGGVSEGTARDHLKGVLIGPGDNPRVAILAHVQASKATHEDVVAVVKQASRTAGIPDSELHLAGGPVTSAALNDGVRSTQWNAQAEWWQFLKRSPSIASALVSVLLALVLLRSIRLAAMVLFVSVCTAAATTVLIPLSGGTMNMVLVVVPTLMTVLTLSGAIHLVNYWKHAAVENRETAVARAHHTAAQPCLLAVGTTAIGMLSLLTSDLTPVRHFGIFTAIGVIFSVAMVLYGLPALLILWPPRQVSVSKHDATFWQWLSRLLVRHHRETLGICMVVIIAASLGMAFIRTETRLIRFFPTESNVVADHIFIEQQICGLIPIDVAVTFDAADIAGQSILERAELVRRIQANLQQLPDVSGTLSFANFCKPLKHPDESSPRLMRMVYGRVSSEVKKHLETGDGPTQELARIAKTELSFPGTPQLPYVTAGMEVWRIKAYASALTETDFGVMMSAIETQVSQATTGQAGVQSFITGTAPLFLRTQEAVLQSLIKSFGLAFVLIEIILIIQLRGIRAGSWAMLPNVAPILLVFGLLSWMGVPIDIGSMVTASVALGIAIDGTVHLLTWFEKSLRSGMSRDDAVVKSLTHCGTAMWHTTAIICFGLLVLLSADLLLVSRFGWLMAALVFAALLGDVIVLPALLAGPLGRLIEARVNNHSAAPEALEQFT